MTAAVRWEAGSPAVRAAVEAWLAAEAAGPPARGEELRDNPRRRLVRIAGPDGGSLLVKQFRVGSGRHARREAWKARVGRSPAAREWRALVALRAAGVAVPEPLALGTLPGGDRLLVQRFVEGPSLADALRAPAALRRRTLADLGARVEALHAAGFVHGDLHHGNVIVGARGPVLVDLQHARRGRAPAARMRDLGFLDHALSELASCTERVRVHEAALGLARPFGPAARDALRAVARASAARAREHAASRTRHSLRPGRAYAAVRRAGLSGLRVRELSVDALEEALAAHAAVAGGAALLKDDARSRVTAVRAGERSVVVKEHRARGLARALADLGRGSPAFRAWRGGHGLRHRGVGAARPLAYLERRRLGVPFASWVVLEDVRPAWPADRTDPPADAARVVAALGALVTALHRRGIDHGDLKASHVFLAEQEGALVARLIDLEGVRFRERVPDARRRRALAQLNASLPDVYPAPPRSLAFQRYTRTLPFPAPAERVKGEIVAESLARRHRWSGAGCREGEGGASGAPGR